MPSDFSSGSPRPASPPHSLLSPSCVRQIRVLYAPFQLSREPTGAVLLPNSSRHLLNRKLFADIVGQGTSAAKSLSDMLSGTPPRALACWSALSYSTPLVRSSARWLPGDTSSSSSAPLPASGPSSCFSSFPTIPSTPISSLRGNVLWLSSVCEPTKSALRTRQ